MNSRSPKADRELETAESKHYATVTSYHAELERLKEAEQRRRKSQVGVVGDMPDQILLDKLADVQLRLSKQREEADDLRTRIANCARLGQK